MRNRIKFAVIYISIFVLFLFFPLVSSITIVVNKEECLRLRLEMSEVLTGSFVVVDGGSEWRDDSAELDFQVFSPGGMKVYETLDSVEDSFQVVAQTEGLHRICFINKEPLSENVDFSYVIGHSLTQADPAAAGHLEQVASFLQHITDDVKLIQQHQAYFRAKEARKRRISENTKSKVFWYTILETGVLIGASFLQVFLLRRMFEKRGRS